MDGVEIDQTGLGPGKATCVEVEEGGVVAEVHVEPLAPGHLRLERSVPHNSGCDAFALAAASGLGVDEERVVAAVPGDVHEANELTGLVSGRGPPKAVGPDLVPPTGHGVAAARVDEIEHLVVGDRSPPRTGDPTDHGCSLALMRRRHRRFCRMAIEEGRRQLCLRGSFRCPTTTAASGSRSSSTRCPATGRGEVDGVVRHRLPPPGFRRVLDVCCGPGRHAKYLVDAGYEVTGIDRDAAAVQRAKAEIARGEHNEIAVGYGKALP